MYSPPQPTPPPPKKNNFDKKEDVVQETKMSSLTTRSNIFAILKGTN